MESLLPGGEQFSVGRDSCWL